MPVAKLLVSKRLIFLLAKNGRTVSPSGPIGHTIQDSPQADHWCIHKMMSAFFNFRHARAKGGAPHNAEPDPTKVVPFGLYGAGGLTGHPIGLVIVIGLFLGGLIAVPGARLFFAASLFLGGILGLLLWLRHR